MRRVRNVLILLVILIFVADCGPASHTGTEVPTSAPVLPVAARTGSIVGQVSPNESVSLEGSTRVTRADAQGRFQLDGVPGGSQTLIIGSSRRLPVTVAVGQTVRLGGERLTREQALSLVRDRFGPADIYGSQNLLPTGAEVSTPPLDVQGVLGPVPASVRPAGPFWLFFVDPEPQRDFEHDVSHVIVDDATGRLTEVRTVCWPALNGVPLWNRSADVGERLAVRPRTRQRNGRQRYALFLMLNPERLPSADWVREAFAPDDYRTVLASDIVVPGLEPNAQPKAEVTKPAFIAAYRKAAQAAFDELNAQIVPGDLLLIYLYGHGARGRNCAAIEVSQYSLGEGRYVRAGLVPSEFLPAVDDYHGCELVTFVECCYAGGMLDLPRRVDSAEEQATLNARSLAFQLEEHLPARVRALAFVSSGADGAAGHTEKPATQPNLGYFTVEFFTPRYRFDPLIKHPEPTEVQTLEPSIQAVRTYDDFKTAFAFLTDPVNLKASNSETQKPPPPFERLSKMPCHAASVTPTPTPTPVTPPTPTPTPTPGTPPTPTPTPTPVTPPTPTPTPVPTPTPTPVPTPTPEPTPGGVVIGPDATIQFVHVRGVTPCPQKVGSYTVQNTGALPTNVTVTGVPFMLTVSPTSATVAPGQNLTIDVFFNCSTTASFGPQPFNISATGNVTQFVGRVAGTIQ